MLTGESQSFQCDIKTVLVSMLEAVDHGTRGAGDAAGSLINLVNLNALVEDCGIETVNLHWRRTNRQARTAAALHRELDGPATCLSNS
ncbi:MAG: hypothetical protein OEZ09_16930 [Betaproteobacteria bacterium]|nr:hypothetical protein [Betaproteobacteria bacterium]